MIKQKKYSAECHLDRHSALDAEKLAAAVLLYVLLMGFRTSLFPIKKKKSHPDFPDQKKSFLAYHH